MRKKATQIYPKKVRDRFGLSGQPERTKYYSLEALQAPSGYCLNSKAPEAEFLNIQMQNTNKIKVKTDISS